MKWIYKITYPNGKIYIGQDRLGSYRYTGSGESNRAVINADFEKLPEDQRKKFSIEKEILWESDIASDAELTAKEIEYIRLHRSHDPAIGYNQRPKFMPGESGAITTAETERTDLNSLQQMSPEKMSALGLCGEWWENGIYRVLRKRGATWEGRSVVQLSIRRHDGKAKEPSWREKQQIKNQLAGDNCEGIELYPAESRLRDQVNQYHLWIVEDSTYRFRFGWQGRATWENDQGEIEEDSK